MQHRPNFLTTRKYIYLNRTTISGYDWLITRDSKNFLAGFFSAKLRKHQVTWLPCEIEALSITAAVKHSRQFLIQTEHRACVLTDSKPCVQAIQKLRRGEFSASPRVTSFLSTASRYQIDKQHLAGSTNIPSDFASRNAAECDNPACQICPLSYRPKTLSYELFTYQTKCSPSHSQLDQLG